MIRRAALASRFQRRVLARHFDPAQVDQWMTQARTGLETFISQIPYIGGKENEFTKYLTMPPRLIPLVRALRDDDVPTRRVGQVIFESAAAAYRLIPAPIRWGMGRSYFTEEPKAKWRQAD